ncbi:MAG: response regulator transcription factor [Thermoplasmata archaeon]|nr:response regulator transcription factor [Thermoplasmata archaeon]
MSMVGVVLLDDERFLHDVMRNIVEFLGHRFLGGYTSLRSFLERAPEGLGEGDLIVVDLSLEDFYPERDIVYLKKRFKGTRVYLFSGRRDAENIARRWGADGVMLKPLSIDEIGAHLRRAQGVVLVEDSP